MKISDINFRLIDHQFLAIKVNDDTRCLIETFPNYEIATVILAIGYIDHYKGVSLRILSGGVETETGYQFFQSNYIVNVSIALFNVQEELDKFDVEIICDNTNELLEFYQNYISDLIEFEVNENIKQTRSLTSLDGFRDKYLVDTVIIYLVREGYNTETCWGRIEGVNDNRIYVELLEEPKQDFGYEIGQVIYFTVEKNDNGDDICVADLSQHLEITTDKLENGKYLEEVSDEFYEHLDYSHYMDVLTVLRHSLVYIPCTAIFDEKDENMLFEMTQENNVEDIVGKIIQFSNDVRMIPDILQNKDGELFFPIFSSKNQIGEYGESFSFVQKNILDVITLAKNSKKKSQAIVLNPFTNNIIFSRDTWELIRNIKLRIKSK
jgi:hypothetical protein